MFRWIDSHRLSISYIYGLVQGAQESEVSQDFFSESTYVGINDELVPLRVFEPQNPRKLSIILYPGASPFAEKHPSLSHLASVMCNLGYRTFVPRIPPLMSLDISENNVPWFAKSFSEIQKIDSVFAEKISVVGLSFGGSILLKALLEKEMQSPQPKSVLTYGSCNKIESGLQFLLTGEINVNGQKSYIKPDDWGLTVMFHNYLACIDAGFDTSEIRKILKDRVADDLDAVTTKMEQLNYHDRNFLENVFSGNITPEIKTIAEEILKEEKNELDKISPATFSHLIENEVFVVHGSNDSMVPYTESLMLAKNLPNAHLYISHLYEHKEISSNSGKISKIYEFIKMERFFALFFRYNEA